MRQDRVVEADHRKGEARFGKRLERAHGDQVLGSRHRVERRPFFQERGDQLRRFRDGFFRLHEKGVVPGKAAPPQPLAVTLDFLAAAVGQRVVQVKDAPASLLVQQGYVVRNGGFFVAADAVGVRQLHHAVDDDDRHPAGGVFDVGVVHAFLERGADQDHGVHALFQQKLEIFFLVIQAVPRAAQERVEAFPAQQALHQGYGLRVKGVRDIRAQNPDEMHRVQAEAARERVRHVFLPPHYREHLFPGGRADAGAAVQDARDGRDGDPASFGDIVNVHVIPLCSDL